MGILGLYWGYMGIMEKKMEITMVIIGFHWGYISDDLMTACLRARHVARACIGGCPGSACKSEDWYISFLAPAVAWLQLSLPPSH